MAGVHVVEPSWNEEKIQQVIGRAVRYLSHTGPNRRVDVYRYLAVFPENFRQYRPRQAPNSILMEKSADEILKIITTRKSEINKLFLRRLVRLSQDTLRQCM